LQIGGPWDYRKTSLVRGDIVTSPNIVPSIDISARQSSRRKMSRNLVVAKKAALDGVVGASVPVAELLDAGAETGYDTLDNLRVLHIDVAVPDAEAGPSATIHLFCVIEVGKPEPRACIVCVEIVRRV